MKTFLLILIFLFSINVFSSPKELTITTDIYNSVFEPFNTYGGDGPYDSFLSMNIKYDQIKNLRLQIENALNIKLDYLKTMNPLGEAHVTVITPVEYFNVLKDKISIDEINKLAIRYEIQKSDLKILGLGSSKKMINEKVHETFFVIVDSYELRNIRQQVFYEYVRRGGDKSKFDPTWFFPHITVGFIGRDLHESDGVLKNLKHSLDNRFNLKLVVSKK